MLTFPDELTLARLGAAKGCETVIALLLKHGTASASVGWLGCRAVFALCAYDQNRPKFHNSDTVNGVVNALSAHPADANVAEWACATIVRLAKVRMSFDGPIGAELMDHNIYHGSMSQTRLYWGVQVKLYVKPSSTTWALLRLWHWRAKRVLLNLDSKRTCFFDVTCLSVCDLAGHDGNRLLLGEHGACEILTTALGNHKENPNISQQICRAIAGEATLQSIDFSS